MKKDKKVMTEFEIIVIEYDSTGYYYPKYKTVHTVISESMEEAKKKAIERTPFKNKFGNGWVQVAKISKSKDLIVEIS